LQSTAGASGIQVVRDDEQASILRMELSAGEIEWVVFNPEAASVQVAGNEIAKPFDYFIEQPKQ